MYFKSTICHILEIKWVDAKLILILNVFFEKENITQDAANSEIHFKREICENSINYIMSMNLSDFFS